MQHFCAVPSDLSTFKIQQEQEKEEKKKEKDYFVAGTEARVKPQKVSKTIWVEKKKVNKVLIRQRKRAEKESEQC